MPRESKYAVAHVTHEAMEKIGGIGTVLEGIMTSPSYRDAVSRSVLIGPMPPHPFRGLAPQLREAISLRYSSVDGIDNGGFHRRLRPIELAFNVAFTYGVRTYRQDDGDRAVLGEAEILLIDVQNPNQQRLNEFKSRLWEYFGIDARRLESDWGFEEYCRLAEPAFYALSALLNEADLPCIVLSHEFMGICTALKAVLDGGDAFRTVFHAHECSTARRIVEHHPGHDTAFYNLMLQANEQGLFVEDVFGSQQDQMRHTLISRTHHLDAIMAVGDPTADELHFLSREMHQAKVDLVYNGLPDLRGSWEDEQRSRGMLDEWAKNVMGFVPDLLMTHVTRPVISKGMWRDLNVLHHLNSGLEADGRTALFVILTCGAPPRTNDDVNRMAAEYGWPRVHQRGYPDLAGMEVELDRLIVPFNRDHKNVQVVLVNQFGWGRRELGDAAPAEMTFSDLRRATDVEFGQSIYEPFGIAHLEPLGSGAICVPSSICGCVWAYRRVLKQIGADEATVPNVLVADYTQLPEPKSVDELRRMTQDERDRIGEKVARTVAAELLRRLPFTDDDRKALLKRGRDLASRMDWDGIISERMLPLFDRIAAAPSATSRLVKRL